MQGTDCGSSEDAVRYVTEAEGTANHQGEETRHPASSVASADTFVAYSPELEDVILPQAEDLAEAIRALNAF